MDEADVCLLMLDADKGITAQDVNIFSLAARKGKGIVVLVNKWDLIDKSTNTARDYEKQLKEKISTVYRCAGNIYFCKRKNTNF